MVSHIASLSSTPLALFAKEYAGWRMRLPYRRWMFNLTKSWICDLLGVLPPVSQGHARYRKEREAYIYTTPRLNNRR